MKIQIGNRFFTVLFEGPVCCHIKMAPEKPTQIGQEDKGSLLVKTLLLKNTILSLILTFLTRASVNSFEPWREEWLTDKTGVFTNALKCGIWSEKRSKSIKNLLSFIPCL